MINPSFSGLINLCVGVAPTPLIPHNLVGIFTQQICDDSPHFSQQNHMTIDNIIIDLRDNDLMW
jgi:hypothetical protein